ncbi:hypothetical protein L6164_034272 [Bauhinia variegata]|uniref:Uncharacterized protein n=1 Tax=Bauhinia variegata TaxID=167791 RepID=A0ACB9KUE6_BAUVA|nr:hypothetical protein L6164_034272 [Bauhinia variegata]
MALLCFNSLTPLYSSLPSSSCSSTLAVAATAVSRLHVKPINLPSKPWSRVRISTPFTVERTGAVIVRVAADAGGTTSAEDGDSPAESKKEDVPVDKLPLESKLKEREEQRLKMKLAKKIRLRRKRLVRKRRMRKKGRWPPSKMKKLKNV